MNIKKSIILLFSILFFSLSFNISHESIANEKSSFNKKLPNIKLQISDSPDSIIYLGLKKSHYLYLNKIDVDCLLIDIFSFYCPICHKQAPALNKIYKNVQQDPELNGRLKIIGIGAGNNLKEVKVYKEKFNVMFPLFTDQDFSIYKQVGEPRTPFLILTKNGKIIMTYSGDIKDYEDFYKTLKTTCKTK